MYHLFCYDVYYPCGGLSDYKQSFPSVKEALQYLKDNGAYLRDRNELIYQNPEGKLEYIDLRELLNVTEE